MNERIKELETQCKVFVTDGASRICVVDTEKFAELIVKECAGICDQQGRVGWNDDRKSQARLDRDLIKQHFGVGR